MNESVVANLERGLERVRRGWMQGYLDHDGYVCAAGGLLDHGHPDLHLEDENEEIWLREYRAAEVGYLADLIRRFYPKYYRRSTVFPPRRYSALGTVYRFNDASERTKAQVEALYVLAIREARKQARMSVPAAEHDLATAGD